MEAFSDIKKNCKKKTRRSIFAFRRYLDPSKLSINVCNKRFDALFLSILTYSSEVWGAYDKSENTTWEKDTIGHILISVKHFWELINVPQMQHQEMN